MAQSPQNRIGAFVTATLWMSVEPSDSANRSIALRARLPSSATTRATSKSAKLITSPKAIKNAVSSGRRPSGALGRRSTRKVGVARRAVHAAAIRKATPRRARADGLAVQQRPRAPRQSAQPQQRKRPLPANATPRERPTDPWSARGRQGCPIAPYPMRACNAIRSGAVKRAGRRSRRCTSRASDFLKGLELSRPFQLACPRAGRPSAMVRALHSRCPRALPSRATRRRCSKISALLP